MTDTIDQSKYRIGTLTYTRYGLMILFFWLLWGDFTMTMMESVLPSILPLKLKELGASNTIMSVMLGTIPNMMNFLVNPVISFKSDRYRSVWGRRIPFLFWATPPITIFLILIAFAPEIGVWLHTSVISRFGSFGQTSIIIATIAVLTIMFQFFNLFICSVYYYLFNDVVPEAFMARFMSFFRFVGTLAGMLYSYFIFQHAMTHMREIFLGAALLYFVGFMLMCWRVKEGKYPDPEPLIGGKQRGIWASIKTYCRESYSHPLYLSYYGFSSLLQASGACMFVANLFYLHLGISLEQIGKFNAYMAIPGLVLVVPLGWLVDKFHPVRVTFWCMPLFPVMSLLSFFVVHDYTTMIIMTLVGFPIGMFYACAAFPMQLHIFPKETFGQFGSADAVVRSILSIALTAVAGFFLDMMSHFYGGNEEYYRWMYIWCALFQFGSLLFVANIYRLWKKHGGLHGYKPPDVGTRSTELPDGWFDGKHGKT